MKSRSGKKQRKPENKQMDEGLKLLARLIVEKMLKDTSLDKSQSDKNH